MESKKINQLATELTPSLDDLTIIGDPSTGISKKITLSQMAALFTGTVEEYASLAAFPLVGVADTIYIATDTNILYRWSTSLNAYVELSPNIISSLVFNDSNGFDGTISLVGSTATLTITTTLTSGSVAFGGASGALSQDNTNFYWDNSNKRLGINTNAPTVALDAFGSGIIGRVNGTSTNNAFLGFASNGTNKWSIGNVQSDHRFRIYNEATTSELVSVLQTGEFGIGIANPTTKFHIDGAASALIVNLDANVSIAKSISFRSDNSNRWNIEVSGTESTGNAGMDFFLRSYSDAGALIETPLSIVRSTGVTTIKSLTLTNALSIANGGTGSTTQNFVDLTTSQSIAGTKTFTNTLVASQANANMKISGGVVDAYVGVGLTNSKFYLTDYATAAKGIVIDLTNGYVGINTDSPASPLQVNGTILSQVGSGAGSIIEAYTLSGQDAVLIANGNASTAQFGVPASTTGVGSRSNHDFVFLTNSTEKARLTTGGRLGINTDNPSSQLHIIGTDNQFIDGIRVRRSSSVNQYAILNMNGGVLNLISVDQSGNNLAATYFYRSINGTSTTLNGVFDANGKFGIGIEFPDLQLSVNGAINMRNSTRAGAFEIDASGNLWIGTATTSGNIYLETGHSTTGLPSTGTARLTLNQNGATFSSSLTATSAAFNTSIIIGNVSSLTGAWGNLTSVLQLGNSTTDKGYISVNEISGDDDINIVRYAYFDNTNWKRIGGGNPSRYYQRNAEHCFQYASSGADNSTITWNNALYISNSGNVGIGCTPNYPLQVNSSTSISRIQLTNSSTGTASGDGFQVIADGVNATLSLPETGYMSFETSNTERIRIASDGDFFVNATTNTGFTNAHRIKGPSSTENTEILSIDGGVEYSGFFKAVSGANYNAAACGMVIGRNTTSLRSINAGGTINASGADYAEYMTKAIDDDIAKGDIVGVNIDGKLTNIFDDAISFVVKSTDPSYVGGDTWGNSENIGKEPRKEEEQTDEEYEQLKAEYQIKLEEARAKVDRIAFSGQIPCNVMNANVGDYIIPIKANDGKIIGQAISNPSFEQYKISVGKVWKIMDDGRAWIAVKIG